jgi:hypothetical protein
MQAADTADTIKEVAAKDDAEATGLWKMENQAALLIAFLAMCLAITSVAGGDNEQLIMQTELKAADTFAFFQAKNIRRTSTILAKDQLEMQLLTQGAGWTPEARQAVQQKIAFYDGEIDRYRNEPEEGTQDLLNKARALEAQRDEGVKKDPNFDFAEGLFQIAIVVSSVSIITKVRALLIGGGVLGLVALVLMLNGFFLFLDLPWG